VAVGLEGTACVAMVSDAGDLRLDSSDKNETGGNSEQSTIRQQLSSVLAEQSTIRQQLSSVLVGVSLSYSIVPIRIRLSTRGLETVL
jgi:hypothetical protein